MAQFIMVVEAFPEYGKSTEFRVDWDGVNLPMLVRIDDDDGVGKLFTYEGGYAGKGQRYRYSVVEVDVIKPVEQQTIGQYDGDSRWLANN